MKLNLPTGLAFAVLVTASSASAMEKRENKAAAPIVEAGQLIFYERPNFGGDAYLVEEKRNSIPMQWNVASIAVYPGESWQICEKPRFREPCLTVSASEKDVGQMKIASARRSSEIK